MGRITTKDSQDMKGMMKAHKMAEAFAEHRTEDFLKAFLEDTELLAVLKMVTQQEGRDWSDEAVLKFALQDYKHSMGKALALAYACGYCDAIQKKTIKQLYVPKGLEIVKPTDEVDKNQLPLPGIE